MAGSTTDLANPSALARRLLDIEPGGRSTWLDPAACQAVIARGLPDTRGEPWKYTNVNRWYDVALAPRDTGSPRDIGNKTRPMASSPWTSTTRGCSRLPQRTEARRSTSPNNRSPP